MEIKKRKKSNKQLAKILATAGGATALGVGTGLLAENLLKKAPTKNRALRSAILAALPASIALGALSAKRKNEKINEELRKLK